jgi:DNA-binding response OmpR family regulator
MQKSKILLAEDDATLGFLIKDNLEEAGFAVTHCNDGAKAWRAFQAGAYDICVLDVMMPKKDGFSLAQDIRKTDQIIPIIFLTAKGMREDKSQGFTAGGDDYITKPFEMEELIFRIQVFLKRTPSQNKSLITISTFEFDYNNLQLFRNGEMVKGLTQKEADILRFLSQNMNQMVKREDILVKVWGENDYFLGRSLDVFISKLRKYLKDDPAIEILNYHGIGFRFCVKEH